MKRQALITTTFALLAGLLTACGSGNSDAQTITLYNAQHEQTTDALISAFTKQTGIKVRVKNDEEDVLTAQIRQEGSHSPADVVYTENSNWLEQLNEANLLAPIDAATLASVPRDKSAANGNWAGVSARVSGVVHDPNKVAPGQLPASILDLSQPQWKGKIGLAPAETDFWPLVASVEKAKGKEATLAWLEGLKANAGKDANVPDNETLINDIDTGNGDLGIVNHYYFYRAMAEKGQDKFNAKFGYFAPGDPGYVLGISGAGVLKSSKKQAAAQQFVAFLTSPAGQEVLAQSDSFEYPINPSVKPSPGLTPLDQLHPTNFTPADLGTGLDAKSLMQQAGLL